MPADQLASPFGDDTIEEIRLHESPLVKVLTQIRYPSLAVLRDESVISAFASRLGKQYPVLDEQRGVNLLVTPTGLVQQQSNQRIWNLRSRDERWKVTVAENFLALETSQYSSRSNFISQFRETINQFIELADPPYFERLGIRYINRVDDVELINGQLKSMIRKEMLGALTIERPEAVELRHTLSDSLLVDGEHSIQLRCGVLPPNTALDSDIKPVDRPIWILDADSFLEKKMTLTSDEVTAQLNVLANRAYRMFRWVVNADFIDHFRGDRIA